MDALLLKQLLTADVLAHCIEMCIAEAHGTTMSNILVQEYAIGDVALYCIPDVDKDVARMKEVDVSHIASRLVSSPNGKEHLPASASLNEITRAGLRIFAACTRNHRITVRLGFRPPSEVRSGCPYPCVLIACTITTSDGILGLLGTSAHYWAGWQQGTSTSATSQGHDKP